MTPYPLTKYSSDNYHLSMEKEKLKIRVMDQQSGQILLECGLNESERAYSFAAQLEELGLNVKVETPTLSDTLSNSLGLNQSELAAYQESLDEEMDHHAGSCCFEESDSKKLN